MSLLDEAVIYRAGEEAQANSNRDHGVRSAAVHGHVARAAREAGLDRKHFYSLLHKYGLVQSEGE